MYQQNNIEFRIASAGAIGKFKTTQAHSFIQVCRREFEFDISSREVVLLSFDRFSSWLVKLEKLFLREEEKKKPSKALNDLVMATFIDELRQIEGTCAENPTIFSAGVVEFLKIINSYAPVLMKSGVDMAFNENPSRAFAALADCLSDYLQHVLISMHEFNNNLVLMKEPFICVAPFCLTQRKSKKNCDLISLRTRAAYFRKKIHGSDLLFVLKNYCEEDLFDEAVETLSSMGIFARSEMLETV